MKFLKIAGFLLLILILIYFLGPTPSVPVYAKNLPEIPASPDDLEYYILEKESSLTLKPDNQARIIWNDSIIKNKTEYSVVYLHGFSASQEEGDPVHINFSRRYGFNLYLSRLADHGVQSDEPMLELTAEKLWQSAREAFAIGKQLGNNVILMATSTGGTLALKLAAEYDDIAALILLSPNIAIHDDAAKMLNNPWGLQIARMMKGKYMVSKDTTEIYKRYWHHRYRMESTVQLQELLETTMKGSVFEKVKEPVLLMYYFKDEENQDHVVKVSAMQRMFRQLGTDSTLKKEIAVPGAGDHVIGSYIKSKDIESVQQQSYLFAEKVLGLKPLKTGEPMTTGTE
ncbi:MAG: alpha/beta hydrolase [Chitinophagaceae bacterium]|jgi:esterase/lipase|nr:alpha/beta hydrolase [Chitinophagaceae bacterium]